MKNFLHNLMHWLVISSANPERTSMTIKGILVSYVALVVLFGQTLHIPVTQTLLVENINKIVAVLGLVLIVFGLVRKIVLGQPINPLPPAALEDSIPPSPMQG